MSDLSQKYKLLVFSREGSNNTDNYNLLRPEILQTPDSASLDEKNLAWTHN